MVDGSTQKENENENSNDAMPSKSGQNGRENRKRTCDTPRSTRKPSTEKAFRRSARQQNLQPTNLQSNKRCQSNQNDDHAKRAKSDDEPRYKNVDHIVFVDPREHAMRCKLLGCDGKTHFYCKTCDKHLCILKDRNCFAKYHTKPTKRNHK